MTLDEFIDKLFKRYVCATDTDEKKEEYASNLFNLSGKVDFLKLLDVVSRNNEKDFVPSVHDVLEWARSCYKSEYKKTSSQWLQVRVYNPFYKKVVSNDCFPNGTTEEQMLKYYQKRFGGEGWKIVEVY